MSFCTNCGRSLEADENFCTNCGSKNESAISASQNQNSNAQTDSQNSYQPSGQPNYQNNLNQNPQHNIQYQQNSLPPTPPIAYQQNIQPGFPNVYQQNIQPGFQVNAENLRHPNLYIDAIKRSASSFLFVFGIILLTALFALEITSAFIYKDNVYMNVAGFIEDMVYDSEYYYEASRNERKNIESFLDGVYDYADTFNNTYVVRSVVGNIPTILITIGLWLFCSWCKSRGTEIKTSGLTIIKGVYIYFLVIHILITLLALISIASVALMLSHMIESVAGVVFVIAFIVLGIIASFAIAFDAAVIKIINNLKHTLIMGAPRSNFGVTVPVLIFLSSLGSLSTAIGLFEIDAFYGFISLLSAAVPIIFAIAFLIFRSKLRSVNYTVLYNNYN